jgi:hypothetical protein
MVILVLSPPTIVRKAFPKGNRGSCCKTRVGGLGFLVRVCGLRIISDDFNRAESELNKYKL